ncbi:MAG TPA: hypothetical protein P5110_07425 [Candidatus Omnitrophota bacterium]|nr:hypothetical protein [Candidatus Omnitrophota bacterium]
MKINNQEIERYRQAGLHRFAPTAGSGNNGAFLITIPSTGAIVMVVSSDGGGWDHVSVSCRNRCPRWEEMCYIKDLFFEPEETVIQFHPKKSAYVNNHPYCLHLWKKQGAEIELPPTEFVGVKS